VLRACQYQYDGFKDLVLRDRCELHKNLLQHGSSWQLTAATSCGQRKINCEGKIVGHWKNITWCANVFHQGGRLPLQPQPADHNDLCDTGAMLSKLAAGVHRPQDAV